MNRPVPFLLFSGLLLLFSAHTAVAQRLTLVGQTDRVFRVPQSVLIDLTRKICYVSNIDGVPGEKGAVKGLLAQPEGIYVADAHNGRDLIKISNVAPIENDSTTPPEYGVWFQCFSAHYDLYVSKMILYL